ncbi:MAG: lysine-sensitive aspartokinase 3 [Bryobacterales bacterium]|nr:lysine-sensitive aspartokinase 3 [Bryobacteraceae bacterium]MDW8129275.1 lysine-sensitive aspartokinase 3 [Bryobacterales bacterium]
MIVMKFGGTSVESAAAIERVSAIVRARLGQRPVVVVSAMGRTTNRLLEMARLAASGRRDEALAECEALRHFHRAQGLPPADPREREDLGQYLDAHFRELAELLRGLAVLGELTPRSMDAVASYGERLSAAVLAAALRGAGIPAEAVDSRRLIVTDRRFTQAAPLYELTYPRLAREIPPLAGRVVPVLGGFIAATEDGVTTTLGRGGSDFTAAIVGAGIGAREIQIWTDVDGMLTADPNLVEGARRVKIISFDEAAELAYFGAKVLHPATVLPARERNIPVRILNSRRPEIPGTLIVEQAPPCRNPVKSIACKRGITVVDVHSTRMLMAHGFLHRIFEIFDDCQTPVDLLATSEVSVSLTIDNTARLGEICARLRQFAEVGVEQDQAIVCLVGDNIRYTPGVAARTFGALGGINVRMISQGASLRNLSFVVAGEDAARAVRALHQEFFRDPDPEVFE